MDLRDEKDKELKKFSVLGNGLAPYQRNMYPVDIVDVYPPRVVTKHLKLVGNDRDGKEYAIKRTTDDENGMIPASEFFCYELGRLVGISVPEFNIVRLENDELAFGSAWHGKSELDDMMELIKFLDGKIEIKNLDEQIGRIFAFDLFVNNTDRHFGNYLFRTSYHSNVKVMLAFDFGLSWWGYELGGFDALDKICGTQVNFLRMKDSNIKIKYQESLKVLDKIEKIDRSDIEAIINGIPEKWLKLSHRHQVIQWWGSEEFLSRLNTLRLEIQRHELV